MRHLRRAALVVALAGSSVALAGSGSGQASGQGGQREYEKTADGYRESVTKESADGTKVRVSVEQKGWGKWSEARSKELADAKARADAAEAKLSALEGEKSLEGVAGVSQDERGLILTLTGGVLFEFGSDELMPDAKERLDSVAEVLKQAPDAKFTIEGHTDSKGSEEYNKDLSERRAEAVKDYFVSKGIGEGNIETVGHGESNAVASNDTPEGRANNRRVEVVLPEGTLGIGGAGEAGQEEKKAPAPDEDKHMKHQ